MGHGVPSALITAGACATCQILGDQQEGGGTTLAPDALLDHVGRVVANAGKGEILMTFFAAHIDVQAGEVEYANAGHPMPFHIRPALPGRRRLDCLATGPTSMLGGPQPRPRKVQRKALAPGDTLVFYTDGLTDCENVDGKPWGFPELNRILRMAEGASALELRDRIVGAAFAHFGAHPRKDDITLIVIRVLGPGAGAASAAGDAAS
jgi:serine phosphatase RsbU (regulator of sigma subunit)